MIAMNRFADDIMELPTTTSHVKKRKAKIGERDRYKWMAFLVYWSNRMKRTLSNAEHKYEMNRKERRAGQDALFVRLPSIEVLQRYEVSVRRQIAKTTALLRAE